MSPKIQHSSGQQGILEFFKPQAPQVSQLSTSSCQNSEPLTKQGFHNFFQPLIDLKGEEASYETTFKNLPPIRNRCVIHLKFKEALKKWTEIQKNQQTKDHNIRTDLQTSGSNWSMKRFKKYIPPLRIFTTKEELPKSSVSGEVLCCILSTLNRIVHVSKCNDKETLLNTLWETIWETSWKILSTKAISEQQVRSFVDSFIIPIVQSNKMHLEWEENLDLKRGEEEFLPTSVTDYTIYTNKLKILGCIETKTSGTLSNRSVVQGMLQLISLREKAPNTLFNIITDACHFIFVLYKRDGTFQLETSTYSQIKCRVRKMKRWKDFEEVLAIVDALLKNGEKEIENENGDGSDGGDDCGYTERSTPSRKRRKHAERSPPSPKEKHAERSPPFPKEKHAERSPPSPKEKHAERSPPSPKEKHAERSPPSPKEKHAERSLPSPKEKHAERSPPSPKEKHAERSLPSPKEKHAERSPPSPKEKHAERSPPSPKEKHAERSLPSPKEKHAERSPPSPMEKNAERSPTSPKKRKITEGSSPSPKEKHAERGPPSSKEKHAERSPPSLKEKHAERSPPSPMEKNVERSPTSPKKRKLTEESPPSPKEKHAERGPPSSKEKHAEGSSPSPKEKHAERSPPSPREQHAKRSPPSPKKRKLTEESPPSPFKVFLRM